MSSAAAGIRLGAAILAAGASSRMGEPKLLLPWGATSIIGHLLSTWQSVGADQIAVVCAPHPHPLHHELDRLGVPASARIINPSPERGMFSSVRCAAGWAGWNGDLTHIAFLLGDQPQISRSTIGSVLDHAVSHPEKICQPAFHGRPKHPVIFPRDMFLKVAATTSETLRDFLENYGPSRSFKEIPDDSLLIDLDSPADYKSARTRFI
jgi:molybdenum cofactor cytidylyltransferase